MRLSKFFLLGLLVFPLFLTSCWMLDRGNDSLSVHKDEKEFRLIRYDKVLTEYVKSNSFSALQRMNMEYRMPTKILIEDVLELGQVSEDAISLKLRNFFSDSTLVSLLNDVQEHFVDVSELETQLADAFQKLHEETSLPVPYVYTQVSAFNQSIVLSDSLIGVSLDKYMGADYKLYDRFFYSFQSRSMTPERILPDCLTYYLYDNYRLENFQNQNFLAWMLHSGKITYAVQQLLNYRSIGEVLGYTKEEEKWCMENERLVWNYMREHKQLDSKGFNILRSYLKPAAYTPFFGGDAPGMLGVWMGGRIVASYVKLNNEVSLKQVLELQDYESLLEASNYLD